MKVRIFDPRTGDTVCSQSFNTPGAAIDWARAYIQSWPDLDWEEV